MNKKALICIAMLLVASMLLTACGSKVEEPAENTPGATQGTPAAEPEPPQEMYKVTVGVAPYSMFMLWHVAKEWGVDEEFGLDLNLKDFAQTSPASQALARGDVDLVTTCIAEHLSIIKGAPNIKAYSSLGFFKGFFFVGRAEDMVPWDDLVAEKGLKTAKAERLGEFAGKSFCIIPQRKPLIIDAIKQVGLTEDDVTFVNFADDQKAATAFMTGEGDFYIGSLPQQQKLVDMDEYINVGGVDILGPAGVWYDTMVSTDDFMVGNRESALRALALLYRMVELFDEDPDAFSETAAAELSVLTASEFTPEAYKTFQTVNDDFLSIEECEATMYNPDDPLYWKNPVEFYIDLSVESGDLGEAVSADEYYGESEALFNELLSRDDLMDLIHQ